MQVTVWIETIIMNSALYNALSALHYNSDLLNSWFALSHKFRITLFSLLTAIQIQNSLILPPHYLITSNSLYSPSALPHKSHQ